MRIFVLALPLIFSGCTPFQSATFRKASETQPQRSPTSYGSVAFDWPLKNARMTRGFSPYRLNHFGIDLAKPKGKPILAAHDGKVVYAGNKFRGFGKLVILEHPSGWGSLYAHCNDILVKEGDWVSVGKRIATVGRTGNARGVHLHFELRKDKKAVDPLLYLPKL